MVFHGSLSDCKSIKVSRTLLSILSDLINAIVWMVSILVAVPSAPITICITVTFMFHIFFCSLAKSKYLFLFTFLQFSLLAIARTDRLAEIIIIIIVSIVTSFSHRFLLVVLHWSLSNSLFRSPGIFWLF